MYVMFICEVGVAQYSSTDLQCVLDQWKFPLLLSEFCPKVPSDELSTGRSLWVSRERNMSCFKQIEASLTSVETN